MDANSTFTSSTIDFSVVSEAKDSKMPKLNTRDAAWKAQVCENARKIYLSVKYTNIQCAKESKVRIPIVDEDVCESSSPLSLSPLSSTASTICVEPEEKEEPKDNTDKVERAEKTEKTVSFDLEVEIARLQDKLKKMEEHNRQLEDENSLLAWYAHHMKGSPAEPEPPSIESILEEAKTSVLEQALATIEEAAAIKGDLQI